MDPPDPEDVGTLSYYDLFGPGTFWRALDLIAGLFFGALAAVFHTNALFLYGFAAVGSYFGLRGLFGLLAARGVSIDRRRGRARVWRGWLLPLWFRTRRLDRYNTVRIGKELRRDGRRYTAFFAIQLTGAGRAVELTVKQDYLQARQVGEEVAAYLGFDLLDATPGQPVRTAAANVGKSLRERLRAATLDAKSSDTGHLVLPPLPAKARCTCTIDGSWLFLEIPRPRLLGLVGHPLLLPRMFVRYQIEAHPGGLTVRRRGLIFRRTRTLTSSELKELRRHRWGLQAIGGGQVFAFADNGVSAAELAWLHDAITRAVAA